MSDVRLSGPGIPAPLVPETSEGERSEPERGAGTSGAARGGRPPSPPDPEVRVRGRRRFTAEYKARILRMVDAAKGTGEVGAIVRREGLYSSHLTQWRQQREAAEQRALAPKKRGPKGKSADTTRILELEAELAKVREEVRVSRIIIDVQKKMHELLGIPLPNVAAAGRR